MGFSGELHKIIKSRGVEMEGGYSFMSLMRGVGVHMFAWKEMPKEKMVHLACKHSWMGGKSPNMQVQFSVETFNFT